MHPSEYERDLEEVIRDETSGDFTTALLAMLKANKDESTEVDMDLARRDAEVKSGKSTFFIVKVSHEKKTTKYSSAHWFLFKRIILGP